MRLAAIAAVAALATTPAMADAAEYFTKSSPYSVAETMDRLQSAIEEGGASVVARVDHGGSANGAGMDLRPTQLIIFGNPNMGTPLMQEAQSLALVLPLRIAVWEEEGGDVVLAYQDIEGTVQAHGIRDGLEEVEAVIRALEALTDKAVRQ